MVGWMRHRNKCYLSKRLFGLIKHGPGYKILSDRFKNQFFLSKQRTALGAVCNLPGKLIFSPLKAFCKGTKSYLRCNNCYIQHIPSQIITIFI